MDDLELSVRCRQGDRPAYKELYETYSELLMGVCLRYVADKDAACDLLHDAFLKAFGSIHTFQHRGNGSLRAWLTRITVNTALGYLRKNKTLDYMGEMEVCDTAENEIDETSLLSIPEQTIMEFVMELSASTRTVFNLYTFENMTHSEIGKELGIKETASRMRLNRARAILAEKINRYVSR